MKSETIAPPPASCELPQLPDDESQQPPVAPPGETSDQQAPSETESEPEEQVAPATLGWSYSRKTFIATIIIAVILALHVVYFARTILMPIVAGGMLALLFRPVVRRFRRYRVPDAVSAALVLVLLVSLILGVIANLISPANQWLNDAPESLRTVGRKLHVLRDHVEDLSRASQVVEDLAKGTIDTEASVETSYPFTPELDSEATASSQVVDEVPDTPPPTSLEEIEPAMLETSEPIEVHIQQPRLLAGLQVLSSTGSLLAELLIMLVLAYFLLASGDVLINNVLRILPSRREKRNTVELIHNVEHGISSYLLTVTLINMGLGTCVAIAMWLMGLPNPVLWGAMATVFNFVPYLGAVGGTVIVLLVSILSFDSLGYAFLPPLVFWLLTATEGNFVTPHLLGRSMSLNPIMVVLSLTVWGWMWGIGGALLAVPILAVLKVSFDQFDRTQPLGTLLGGDS